MKILLNGQEYEFAGNSLSDLISERKLIPERVFASVNAKVVTAAEYPQITLKSGDEVELFAFVGGG